jgi:hypothetical protein
MMSSAPAAAASWAFSGLLTVVMTRASAHLASWIAALPTAPAPPWTSTVLPVSAPWSSRSGIDSPRVRQRCAVRNGTPRQAPSSSDAFAGSSTALRCGTTVYSAAVPHGRWYADSHSHTRSPRTAGSTPLPTASTTPDPSWFGTWKPAATGVLRRDFQSVGFTPDAATLTLTSPGPGSGTSRSVSSRTSGSPLRV